MLSSIDHALALLTAGELVGIPTETVYGLAADAANPAAVAKIFALKGRPIDHPVIVHITNSAQLPDWARAIPDHAWQLAEAFWPGPLTLILSRQPHVCNTVTGGQDTIGLRSPAHPLAQQLLQRFGSGLAAPSANRFGHVSPTTAQHVIDEFGADLKLVLDGGACDVGVESTIISLVGDTPELLRPGSIAREAIETLLGTPIVHRRKATGIRAPGLLDSHYAPRTPLVTGTLDALIHEAVTRTQHGGRVIILHHQRWPAQLHQLEHHRLSDQPKEYARQLYATLRTFDRQGYDTLLLETTPQTVEWLAIQDRISRAAHRQITD